MTWFAQYLDEIRKGEIIVGRELMIELEKLESDLDNPAYRYDTADADKRIKFIENECRHYEAPWAGKKFLLLLWEKAFIEVLYSFKIYDEDLGRWIRRFREATLLCARKNGKTPLTGSIGLSEFYCGEMGTKIMCSSNDYDQASLMFDGMNAMREESPKLARTSRKNIKGIFMGNPRQKNARGKFSYQNKASVRKMSSRGGAKEGRNLKVVFADEVHEMQDNTLIEPLRQAISTQDEPLFIEITTEGFIQDGYLDMRLQLARKVLNGEAENDRWLIWLYTQDSEEEVWQDEQSWRKSNPSLGPVKKFSYLRDRLEEAKQQPSTRAFTLAKDFNIKQNAAVAWLSMDQILDDGQFTLEDFRGMPYIAGDDFAETTDLCASVILLKRPDSNRTFLHPHFWIPEAKADIRLSDGDNSLNPEKKDYREWERRGFVTICPGSEVLVSEVADYYYNLYELYGIVPYKVGYDNRFALEFRKRFEFLFGEGLAEPVLQTAISLSEPMRTMEAEMTAHIVCYNQNPVFRWNLENISVETDKNGYIKPKKNFGNPRNRIDGGAAALNCYAMLQRNRADFMEMVQIMGVNLKPLNDEVYI